MPTCCHIVPQLIVLLICSAHTRCVSSRRQRGRGGWTDVQDVLEGIIKNAQNGLISKVKSRVFTGGKEKKRNRRKGHWVRAFLYNNQYEIKP